MKKAKFQLHPKFMENCIEPDLLRDSNEDLKGEITCLFCNYVVKNPVQCKNKKCSKMFCSVCVAPLLRRKDVCPHRCDGKSPLEVEDIPRTLKNVLLNYKFKCLNFDKGCTEELTYETFNKHHKESCKFIERMCECSRVLESEEAFKSHIVSCELYNAQCPYCFLVLDYNSLFSHVENCLVKKLCNKCKNMIDENAWEEHLLTCVELEVECPFCRLILMKKDENLHTKEECFKETSRYNSYYEQ